MHGRWHSLRKMDQDTTEKKNKNYILQDQCYSEQHENE